MADETTTTLDASAPTTPADWRAGLPEDLRAEKSLESFKDVGALAKSYVETKKMVGDALKVPAADAKPEERAAFYTKLGRPETADKYTVKAPTFPEELGLTWDGEAQSQFLASMHEAGLTNAQVQKALDWYGAYMLRAGDAQIREAAQERRTATEALRTRWGSAMERNVGLARAAVQKMANGDERLLAAADAEGNNPALLELLHAAGELLFERGEIRGDEYRGGRTVDEIQADIDAIKAQVDKNPNLMVQDRILALTQELLHARDRMAGKR